MSEAETYCHLDLVTDRWWTENLKFADVERTLIVSHQSSQLLFIGGKKYETVSELLRGYYRGGHTQSPRIWGIIIAGFEIKTSAPS